MVKIIVCIKQVLDVSQVGANPRNLAPVTKRVPLKISDFDENALEEAVRLKEKHGGNIIALMMASPKVKEPMRKALGMGVDEGYCLFDPCFEGSDSLATTNVLAAAIKKIEDWDLIICGEASIDDYSGQVGPRLAEALGVPQITYVRKVDLDDDIVIAERDLEDRFEIVKANLPVLLTVTKEINVPRYVPIMKILDASKKKVTEWNGADIDVAKEKTGEKGSGLNVLETKALRPKKKCILFDDDLAEATKKLARKLLKEGVVRRR